MNNEQKVSHTMTAVTNKAIRGHYIVIRIDGKTYSTRFGDLQGSDIDACNLQLVNTKGIGREDNLWVKGRLTETSGHAKITPIPFEINVYAEEGDITRNKKEIKDLTQWRKDICERCNEGHLYCEACKKYTWHKEDEEDGK